MSAGELPRIALGQALSLAAPEGYVRLFVNEGRSLAKLLRWTVHQDLTAGYVSCLLSAFDQPDTTAEALTSAAPARALPLVEPLSEREMEVLTLVSVGLTKQHLRRSRCAQAHRGRSTGQVAGTVELAT